MGRSKGGKYFKPPRNRRPGQGPDEEGSEGSEGEDSGYQPRKGGLGAGNLMCEREQFYSRVAILSVSVGQGGVRTAAARSDSAAAATDPLVRVRPSLPLRHRWPVSYSRHASSVRQ